MNPQKKRLVKSQSQLIQMSDICQVYHIGLWLMNFVISIKPYVSLTYSIENFGSLA